MCEMKRTFRIGLLLAGVLLCSAIFAAACHAGSGETATPGVVPAIIPTIGVGGPLAVLAILFPGLFLALTVLACNIVGDALLEALDPWMRRAGRGAR